MSPWEGKGKGGNTADAGKYALSQERTRIEHPNLSSLPGLLISCGCFSLANPNQELKGEGAWVTQRIRCAVVSLHVESRAESMENAWESGVWASLAGQVIKTLCFPMQGAQV